MASVQKIKLLTNMHVHADKKCVCKNCRSGFFSITIFCMIEIFSPFRKTFI